VLNDPEPAGGARPAPYGYRPGQDGQDGELDGDGGASEEARAMAHPNSFVRSAGPGVPENRIHPKSGQPPETRAPEIVDATAAMLSGGKRWVVRPPKH
jgi:hypothetical protein